MKPPIPVPDPDAEALAFRCKFLHYWLVTSFIASAISLPMVILTSFMDQISLLSIIGPIVAFCCVIVGMISILGIIMFPVKVDVNKLRGASYWGKSALVGWQDISSVKRINHFTLPYIKISTPFKKNIIWLPLFLANPYGLRDAVASFTPPDHPLRLALEKEFPK